MIREYKFCVENQKIREATHDDAKIDELQDEDSFEQQEVFMLGKEGDPDYFKGSKKDLLVAFHPSLLLQKGKTIDGQAIGYRKVFFVSDGELYLVEKERDT